MWGDALKFSWKIFYLTFIIIILSYGIGGFVLVELVFNTTLSNAVQSSGEQNSIVAMSFSAVKKNSMILGYDSSYDEYIIESLKNQFTSASADSTLSIGNKSIVTYYDDIDFADNIKPNTRCHRIVTTKVETGESDYLIQTVSRLEINSKDYYIETVTDISNVYENRAQLLNLYQLLLLGVTVIASTVLFITSKYLTKPLENLSGSAKKIASGDFSSRTKVSGSKEIMELSTSFNDMADCIESQITELKEAAQNRDNFVSSFTHELKTPMTSIIGYADLLRSYEMDAGKRRTCADYIYREGKRLESMSRSLLDLMVMKNREVTLSDIDVGKLFFDTTASVRFMLVQSGITLITEYDDATVLAEPDLIKTLIYNLIDNARKASKDGDSIRLSAKLRDNRLMISICDNGIGIPKEELGKITEPFYMVDKSRSRSMGGAGIGLALCKEIALLHGSELLIESEQGNGTRVSFYLTLPLEDDSK